MSQLEDRQREREGERILSYSALYFCSDSPSKVKDKLLLGPSYSQNLAQHPVYLFGLWMQQIPHVMCSSSPFTE